ncbi:MAG: hypothetical protein IJG82_00435, partial [Atopobiaceae bacterium]|nr:hypothetical protein [Atopobiaceae bacterium]
MLSIIPCLAEQKIRVAYLNADGAESTEDLAELGDDVVIDGQIDMLTIDGAGDEGAYKVGDEASIGTLSLGRVERVVIAGSVCDVIMVGGTDVETVEGSSINAVTMGNANDDIAVGDGSSVGEVAALAEHQVSGDTSATDVHIVDAQESLDRHSKALADVAESGNGGATAQPASMPITLGPKEAYADENDDSPADDFQGLSAEDAKQKYLQLGNGNQPISGELTSADESALDYPDTGAVEAVANVGILEELLLGALALVGEAVFDYAFDFSADKLMEALFGGESKGAPEILAQLEEIKEQLEQIEKDIKKILETLQKQAYAQQVDNYLQISIDIRPGREFLDGMVQRCSESQDKSQREAAQKEFALNLLTNDKYKVGG